MILLAEAFDPVCIQFPFEMSFQLGTGLTYGKWFSVIGLILDLLGIALLTLSGIFGEKPFRRLWNLYTDINRSELEESDTPSHDMALTRTIDRPPDDELSSDPINTADYDALKTRLVRSISGAVFLAVGLLLQIIGTVLC